MVIKYDIEVYTEDIIKSIDKVTNQVFKLLPCREEGENWIVPLQNLIIEIGGMGSLLESHADFFPLLCKLEALLTLTKEDDFILFRKTIFDCLRMMNSLKEVII